MNVQNCTLSPLPCSFPHLRKWLHWAFAQAVTTNPTSDPSSSPLWFPRPTPAPLPWLESLSSVIGLLASTPACLSPHCKKPDWSSWNKSGKAYLLQSRSFNAFHSSYSLAHLQGPAWPSHRTPYLADLQCSSYILSLFSPAHQVSVLLSGTPSSPVQGRIPFILQISDRYLFFRSPSLAPQSKVVSPLYSLLGPHSLPPDPLLHCSHTFCPVPEMVW